MKYNVGDIVRIRRDLKEGLDCPFGVNSDMEKLAGRVVTIKAASTVVGLLAGTHDLYNIYEDSGRFNWSQEMLKPVFAAGGAGVAGGVVKNDPRISVNLSDMIRLPCVLDNISLVASSVRRHKSGIESRKEIRKRLLKL